MNLKPKEELENTNPAYQFVGYDACGNREYLVKVKENTHSNKTATNLDDYLFDDWDFEDDAPEDKNEKNDMMLTPENDFTDTNLTAEQFFQLDYKYSLYLLYRYIQKIDLSLQSLQEVLKDGNK